MLDSRSVCRGGPRWSGYITYDELHTIIRQHLLKKPKVFPDSTIKALWCALDADDSNAIQKDEMASFFKLGAPAVHKLDARQLNLSKEHSSVNLVGYLERHGMGNAIASTPTKEMLKELEAAGVALPTDEELTELSKKLNIWLNEKRVLDGKDHSITWFNRTPPPQLPIVAQPVY